MVCCYLHPGIRQISPTPHAIRDEFAISCVTRLLQFLEEMVCRIDGIEYLRLAEYAPPKQFCGSNYQLHVLNLLRLRNLQPQPQRQGGDLAGTRSAQEDVVTYWLRLSWLQDLANRGHHQLRPCLSQFVYMTSNPSSLSISRPNDRLQH